MIGPPGEPGRKGNPGDDGLPVRPVLPLKRSQLKINFFPHAHRVIQVILETPGTLETLAEKAPRVPWAPRDRILPGPPVNPDHQAGRDSQGMMEWTGSQDPR